VSEPDRLTVPKSFVTVSTTVPVPADEPVVYPTKTATLAPGARLGRLTMLGAPTDATAPVREVLAVHPPRGTEHPLLTMNLVELLVFRGLVTAGGFETASRGGTQFSVNSGLSPVGELSFEEQAANADSSTASGAKVRMNVSWRDLRGGPAVREQARAERCGDLGPNCDIKGPKCDMA
jgi:hypothetical protein